MQPSAYPQPPRRQTSPLLVLGIGGGVVVLLVLAAVVVLLVTSRGSSSSGGTIKGSLQIRKVLAVTHPACPAGDTTRVTSVESDACYQLGDGMTVTQVGRVELRPPDAAHGLTDYTVELRLLPADAARFGTLSAQVVEEQQPRNQLAIVVDGKVVSAPTVQETITGGDIVISGNFDRAKAQKYVDLIRG